MPLWYLRRLLTTHGVGLVTRVIIWVDVIELHGSLSVQHDGGLFIAGERKVIHVGRRIDEAADVSFVLVLERMSRTLPIPKISPPEVTMTCSSVGCEWAGIA